MDGTMTGIIGDLVRSRASADRAALQAELAETLDAVNTRHRESIKAEPVITTGDEFQILLSPQGKPMEVILDIWEGVKHPIRFGVGAGELSTPALKRAVGADGPVWHRAREALEAAHRIKGRSVVFHGQERDSVPALACSGMARLIARVLTDMTAKQAKVFHLRRQSHSHRSVAEDLHMSESSVSQILDRAGYEDIMGALDAIQRLWLMEFQQT